MGKILLVEPDKILRQAIGLYLFSEHEVRVEEGFSACGAGSLEDYDLLIVDGAALRENGQLTPEVTRTVQSSKIPTLWLEGDESSHPAKREKLVIVKKPIERELFQSALAGLLSPKTNATETASPPGVISDKTEGPKHGPKKGQAEVKQPTTSELIDLVDVVEEKGPPRQENRSPRKSK